MINTKLVLVHYINIGNIDNSDVEMYIKNIRDKLTTNEDVINYFIPIRDGETRVECINPQMVNKTTFLNAVKNLTRAQIEMSDVISSFKKSE